MFAKLFASLFIVGLSSNSAFADSVIKQELLGVGVSGVKVNLEIYETELPVVPFRSLSGIAWLGEYCQGNTDLLKSKIDE